MTLRLVEVVDREERLPDHLPGDQTIDELLASGDELDDATDPLRGEPSSWSTQKSLVFITLVVLGLWAVIWCAVNGFVQSLAPGY